MKIIRSEDEATARLVRFLLDVLCSLYPQKLEYSEFSTVCCVFLISSSLLGALGQAEVGGYMAAARPGTEHQNENKKLI